VDSRSAALTERDQESSATVRYFNISWMKFELSRILRDRYHRELRDYLIGPLEQHDGTMEPSVGLMVETWLGSQGAKVVTDIVAGKWKKHREVHDKVELHKRRTLTSRNASNLYRELYGLQETFLEHNLMEKHDANRRFFDNSLASPVVEMGWNPAGGWTQ
jgi:hypothetical protein